MTAERVAAVDGTADPASTSAGAGNGVALNAAAIAEAATTERATGEPAAGELRLFALPERDDRAVITRAPARRPSAPRRSRRPSPLLLVVDGTGLTHRVFHAVGGVEAPEGEAAERFVTVLCRLASDARATACVIGFDDPVNSLRRAAEPAYKAQRPPKPPELVALLEDLPALLDQVGFAVVTPPGLEADDVLGSAGLAAERRGVAATLATGDRDAFALVRPTVAVWYLGNGGSVEHVSPSWLTARYGVRPTAYLDFAALRGDTSDNLPGVRGIGAMTAARLLTAYPTVEAALADRQGLARLLGPSLTQTLVEGRATVFHNRELMRIRTDVELDLDAANRSLDRRTVANALRALGNPDLPERVMRAFSRLGAAAWRCPPPTANGHAAAPVANPTAEATAIGPRPQVPAPGEAATPDTVIVARTAAGPRPSDLAEATGATTAETVPPAPPASGATASEAATAEAATAEATTTTPQVREPVFPEATAVAATTEPGADITVAVAPAAAGADAEPGPAPADPAPAASAASAAGEPPRAAADAGAGATPATNGAQVSATATPAAQKRRRARAVAVRG